MRLALLTVVSDDYMTTAVICMAYQRPPNHVTVMHRDAVEQPLVFILRL